MNEDYEIPDVTLIKWFYESLLIKKKEISYSLSSSSQEEDKIKEIKKNKESLQEEVIHE